MSTPPNNPVAYVIGGAAVYMPGDTFGPRNLRDFEFVWITAGSAVYAHDGNDVDAPPGTVILARPGFRETYRWDTKQTSRHVFFHFRLDATQLDWPPMLQWPVARRMSAGDAVRPLFRAVLDGWCRHRRHTPPPPAIGRTVVAMIDAFIGMATASAGSEPTALPQPVQRAIDWASAALRKHPDRPIALDELAAAAKVDAGHLSRLFRARDSAGVSPMHLVQLMRLEQAMTLLERSNLSVQEVAQRCGFASQFHFSRVFRRAYGAPPTELRHRLRQGQPRPASGLPIDTPPIDV